MQEIYKILIAIGVLVFGIFVGKILAKATKEELKQGKKYFQILVVLCLTGALVFLILGNDSLLFGFLFIAVVTSMSLKKK